MAECPKSPDGKHHYQRSVSQHAVHTPNGSHMCYDCTFCGNGYCHTQFWKVPKGVELPTKEQIESG